MIKNRVYIEQIQFLYSNSNVVLLGVLIISMCLGIMLWSTHEHQLVLGWVLANWVLSLVRWLGLKAYCRQNISTIAQAKRWGHFYIASSLISGCLWGAFPILFLDTSSTFNVTAIMVVLFAMMAGSVGSQSAHLPAFLSFSIPAGAPIIFQLANEGGDFVYMAIMFAIFMILNSILAKKYNQLIVITINQKFDNLDLIQELEIKKNEAEKANHEKTRFLASASHDLRQPLQSQRMFAEAIRNQATESKLQDISQKLIESQYSMQAMLDSLLDISRLDAGIVMPSLAPCSLHRLFETIENDFYQVAEKKGIALHLHWPAEVAMVYSDAGLLESILRNLVHNGIRYTESGTVMLAARKRKTHWCLEVRDSGIGISEAQQQIIFDEFIQLGNPERNREKGLGLGLAIVRKLCRLLNYELQVRSRPSAGSVFSVRIPASQENISNRILSHHQRSNDSAMNIKALSKLEILMLDDDKEVRESIKEMLLSLGLRVRITDHSDAAVAMAMEKKPDIMIVDHRLRHDKTGMEAIEEIRKATGMNTPAILLTGDTSPDKLLDLHKAGYPVLHKPISQRELLLNIQSMTGL